MRFPVDECVGPKVAEWLRSEKHEFFSVYEHARGTDDDAPLRKAFQESWVLITSGRHFGERIYRERRRHRGIVLLRLEDQRPGNKKEILGRLLQSHSGRLTDSFRS